VRTYHTLEFTYRYPHEQVCKFSLSFLSHPLSLNLC
jgi:hypothetical protein